MSRKGKRRREDHRARRERAGAGGAPGHEEHAQAVSQRPERPAPVAVAQRKAAKERRKRPGGRRLRVSPWLIAAPVVAAVAALIAWGIMSAGGSSGTTGPAASPTPDSRVLGSVDATFNVEAGGDADDAYFKPDTVTGKVGDLIELVVTNTGTVVHNLVVSGPDAEFDTADDFDPIPNGLQPGETGRVLVKIDSAGSYPFLCIFHPLAGRGTLVLE